MVSQEDLEKIKELWQDAWAEMMEGRVTVLRVKKFLRRITKGRRSRQVAEQIAAIREAKPESARPEDRVEQTKVVDFDTNPEAPNSWKRAPPEEELDSRVAGKWTFNPGEVKLLKPTRRGRTPLLGKDILPEFSDKPVAGAQIVNLYLSNPKLVPEEWKKKRNRRILLLGNIFYSGGDPCVKYVFWDGSKLDWGSFSLEARLSVDDVVLLVVTAIK